MSLSIRSSEPEPGRSPSAIAGPAWTFTLLRAAGPKRTDHQATPTRCNETQGEYIPRPTNDAAVGHVFAHHGVIVAKNECEPHQITAAVARRRNRDSCEPTRSTPSK